MSFSRSIALFVGLVAGSVLCNALARTAAGAAAARGEGGWRQLFASAGLMRPMLAEGFWLRANLAWEAGDEEATRAWSRLALAAEPESVYLRFNIARMTAFDFPRWKLRRESHAPATVAAHWRRAAAEEALAILAEADESAARWIEAGNIALYGAGDLEHAAACFRRAAAFPDAPWYAGRICAELLREAGRPGDAVAWLREWLPRLPADVPAAQRGLVEARLAELERALGRTEAF